MRLRASFVVLAALALGLGAGIGLRGFDASLISAADQVSAIGTTWLNALRMTVMPLIFALLVTSVASAASIAQSGALAARSLALFTILILCAGVYGVAATQAALAIWPVDPEAARAFIAAASRDAVDDVTPPSFAQFLTALVPANPIRAAAEDAVLATVTFAVLFGFATVALAEEARTILLKFFAAVTDAMIMIVRWVLMAAPIGVFALALGVGLHAGIGAAQMLLHYVLVVSGVTLGVCVIAFALGVLLGRIAPSRFAAGAAPVWAIAASSQSSLASLPAMLEAARGPLRVSERVADFVLPLAVAVFRFTSPVANLAVAFFMAHLYGLEPHVSQIAIAILVAFAVSVSAVGLPGQVSFFTSMAPICLALGLPLEILGVLLAVEIVPDIFRTLGNVTGDLAAAAILERDEDDSAGDASPRDKANTSM